jgi:hypothetical protein
VPNNKLVFEGLPDLLEDLKTLPADLVDDAVDVIEQTTSDAAATIRGDYHVRTGRLRNGVSSRVDQSGTRVVGMVTNRSPLANIYENGTQARHTDIGANRGSMPPGHVFVPTMIRKRRQMYERLKDVIARRGLAVSGDA